MKIRGLPFVTVLTIVWVWLSTIEGQQASLVGLPPVDPDIYKDSRPHTYKNAALALKGNSLDRYLTGRQFMMLLVMLVIKRCTSPCGTRGGAKRRTIVDGGLALVLVRQKFIAGWFSPIAENFLDS